MKISNIVPNTNQKSLNINTALPTDKNAENPTEQLVKGINVPKLVFVPSQENIEGIKQEELLVLNILEEIGLIKSEKNIEILKTLIKFKLPINQETFDKASIILDKLEGLLNLTEKESIEIITQEINPLDEDISRIIKIPSKNTNNETSPIKLQNLTETVKETLQNITPGKEADSSLVKKVAFLIKNDMKVSINNLKFLSDIMASKDFLENDIIELIQQMEKEGHSVDKLKSNFEKLLQSRIMNFDTTDKEVLKNSVEKITSLIEDVQKSILLKETKSEGILEKVNTLNSKIDFLNNLNQHSTFFYIPLKLNRNDIEKNLFVLNKKRRDSKEDKLKIFISLDTTNMKKVDVIIEYNNNKLSVDFIVQSQDILNFIQPWEDDLKDSLSEAEYENVYIGFKLREKDEIEPLDLFTDDENQNYLLNVRV